MKRLFAILLVFSLVLCGCEAGSNTPTQPNSPGQSGGNTAEPTRPAEEVLADLDAPALKVMVTINPELELTLSRTNEILEVKALNADAENLLAGMDLEGKAYGSSMTAILEEAQKQGFLKADAKVSISASELQEGAWTAASGQILLKPVEAFQETTGTAVNCELTPAENSGSVIAKTHANLLDGYQEVICYDAGGRQVMNKYIYDNGDYREVHYLTGETFFWGNDGTFTYSGSKDGVYTEYTDYPDGTRSTASHTYDANGKRAWSYYVQANGITSECFYENGQSAHDIFCYPDGTIVEYFYENGEFSRIVTTKPDGTVYESTPGGDSPEGGSPEGSAPQTANPEGTEYYETYYESGKIKTCDTILPNGDYEKHTYYENGEFASVIKLEDGYYFEEYYDENGNRTYSRCKEPDGYEQVATYYSNGNEKTFDRKWPDGSYSMDTNYENGEHATHVSQSDGIYCEMRFDENGRTTYELYRYADGFEDVYHYENGERTSCTRTYPNGETETIILE